MHMMMVSRCALRASSLYEITILAGEQITASGLTQRVGNSKKSATCKL